MNPWIVIDTRDAAKAAELIKSDNFLSKNLVCDAPDVYVVDSSDIDFIAEVYEAVYNLFSYTGVVYNTNDLD